MFDPSEVTILWSTQGGRAKACARRTSRILRDYYQYFLHENGMIENPHPSSKLSSKSSVDGDVDDDSSGGRLSLSYYGTSFDDFGANEFLNIGKKKGNKGGRKIVVMFVSTTGDAEHCDNIQNTWRLL